jgi:MFS family permease
VILVSIKFKPDGADRNPIAEHHDPDLAGHETASPRLSRPPEDPPAAAGCAWAAAWAATWLFASGALLMVFVVVTGNGGPYGVTALIALFVSGVGVAMLLAAAAIWAVHRLRVRSRSRRTAATFAAMTGAVALLAPVVASLVGSVALHGEAWPIPVAGITLLALAAVLGAERPERRPAVGFAAVWLLLLGTLAYRSSTDLRVQVVWLGPSIVNHTEGQVAFTATRSGAFEVRFGANWCWVGRVIAAGRYEWRPGDPGSSFGAPIWVDLPSDVLPLQRGDLVRACVRDGLAAGTAAGEAADPPSFWPRD